MLYNTAPFQNGRLQRRKDRIRNSGDGDVPLQEQSPVFVTDWVQVVTKMNKAEDRSGIGGHGSS